MALSRDEVQHVARLARIGLTPLEEERYQKELVGVFGLIEELKEAKLDTVDVTRSERETNRTREDTLLPSDEAQPIVANFPNTKDRFNKVKAVF